MICPEFTMTSFFSFGRNAVHDSGQGLNVFIHDDLKII